MSETSANGHVLSLSPGEIVRVRSAAEIFATLDDGGRLDGLPFMPEMLKYCGRTLAVDKRADKTCDGFYQLRRMRDAVHLANVRCDGVAHGGCQAACLMYWKEAWLERTDASGADSGRVLEGQGPRSRDEEEAFLAETLLPATISSEPAHGSTPAFRCQATEIPNAATRITRRQLGQYPRDVRNWGVLKVLRGQLLDLFNTFQRLNRKFFPKLALIRGGLYYPFVAGRLPRGATPSTRLDLKPGEWVRIKSKDEILETLDSSNKNRGLSFDVEMVRYCGRIARVRGRVERLVDEQTGKLIHIKTDCVVLDGVVCKADFHQMCTRSTYSYWREMWLDRITPPRHPQVRS